MNFVLNMPRAGKNLLGATLGVLLFSLSLLSQVNTGTISGVVQDTSGAVIAGAMVTVRNVDTGAARTLASDEGGRYVVPVLPVGNYAVQCQQSGFQTEIRSGIALTVGREEVINLTLRVGQQTQSVPGETWAGKCGWAGSGGIRFLGVQDDSNPGKDECAVSG